MSMMAKVFRTTAAMADAKRDAGLTTPEDIQRHDSISYGPHGVWNTLDVYYPKGTEKPLPTIVNVHGGGYVYGDKELYQFYCMSLAQRGFTVVNFTYRLAPEAKFPAPLEDTNRVLEWAVANAAEYHIDTGNIFMVGDSAGAQLTSQYAAIVTNPGYAKLFDFTPPAFTLRAVGLNCGMYNLPEVVGQKGMMKGLMTDYFGKNPGEHGEKLKVLDYITESYPPASITTAYHDFLRGNAQPMADFLAGKGIEVECTQYGSEAEKSIAHVFHCNIREATATRCNDAQCAFFKKHTHCIV